MKELKDALEAVGIESVIATDIDSVAHPVLLVINYRPDDDLPPVCIGISLKYYSQNTLERKFWSTVDTVDSDNRENRETPNRHPDYGDFEYAGRQYMAYSVDLSGYNCDPGSIIELLPNLYVHMDFS